MFPLSTILDFPIRQGTRTGTVGHDFPVYIGRTLSDEVPVLLYFFAIEGVVGADFRVVDEEV